MGVTFYFIEHRDYFERDELYGYDDDAMRFGFFQHATRVVCWSSQFLPGCYSYPWLAPLSLSRSFVERSIVTAREFRAIKQVFTIHNLVSKASSTSTIYGNLWEWTTVIIAIRVARFHDDCISFMKLGILYADKGHHCLWNLCQREILEKNLAKTCKDVLEPVITIYVALLTVLTYDVWTVKQTNIWWNYDLATIALW